MPPVRLGLSSDREQVLIEVWDGNPRPPIPADADLASESGRGLLLVSALRDQWNWRRSQEQGGKVVWAIVAAGS